MKFFRNILAQVIFVPVLPFAVLWFTSLWFIRLLCDTAMSVAVNEKAIEIIHVTRHHFDSCSHAEKL